MTYKIGCVDWLNKIRYFTKRAFYKRDHSIYVNVYADMKIYVRW